MYFHGTGLWASIPLIPRRQADCHGASFTDSGIYTQKPEISFRLPENASPYQYRIRIDGDEKPLTEVCKEHDSSFNLHVPDEQEKVHLIQMYDWRNAKVVYEYRFVVLNHFNCVLEKEIFLNDNSLVKGIVQYNDKLYDIEALPEPDEDCIIVRIQDLDFDLKIDIPLIRCSMNEQNLLLEERIIWYEDISKEDNVRVTSPNGWEQYLYFNGKTVSLASGSDEIYEFGNFVKGTDVSKDMANLNLFLRNDEEHIVHQTLFSIYYRPYINHGLLYIDENRGIYWQPEQNIVCAKDAEFKMYLHISDNAEDDYLYSLTTKNERLCRSFDYDLGVFPYEIYICGKRTMFAHTEDKLLYSDTLRIGNEDEIRLFEKVIHLTAPRRCSYRIDGY